MVRYRGLAKNANRAFAMLTTINILKHGKPLTEKGHPAEQSGAYPRFRPF